MDFVEGILFYAFGDFKLTPRDNNDFGNVIVTIEEISNHGVETSLYPNPAQDRVMIQLDSDYTIGQLQVEIYDVTGKIVMNHSATTHLSSIDLSGMEKGVYFVRVTDNGNALNTSKLILK
jgi:hypothetical protein